jgi:hypothetical protein
MSASLNAIVPDQGEQILQNTCLSGDARQVRHIVAWRIYICPQRMQCRARKNSAAPPDAAEIFFAVL